MFRKQNLCLASKSVFDPRQTHFLVSEQQIFFFRNICFQNLETFAYATMFSQQCFLVQPGPKLMSANRLLCYNWPRKWDFFLQTGASVYFYNGYWLNCYLFNSFKTRCCNQIIYSGAWAGFLSFDFSEKGFLYIWNCITVFDKHGLAHEQNWIFSQS